MNLIDKYIVKTFLINLFLVVSTLSLLVFFVSLTELTSNSVSQYIGKGNTIKIVAGNTLSAILYIIPVCISIATTATLIYLGSTKQLTIIMSSGYGSLRVMRYIIILSFIIGICITFLIEPISVKFISLSQRIAQEAWYKKKKIEKKINNLQVDVKDVTLNDEQIKINGYYSDSEIYSENKTIKLVKVILILEKNKEVVDIIKAKTALLDLQNKTWELSDGITINNINKTAQKFKTKSLTSSLESETIKKQLSSSAQNTLGGRVSYDVYQLYSLITSNRDLSTESHGAMSIKLWRSIRIPIALVCASLSAIVFSLRSSVSRHSIDIKSIIYPQVFVSFYTYTIDFITNTFSGMVKFSFSITFLPYCVVLLLIISFIKIREVN